MIISTMSGENSDFCKDCLIICIPVTPVGDVVDEDRPELDDPDSEQKPLELVVCLSEGSAQLLSMAELSTSGLSKFLLPGLGLLFAHIWK